MGLDINCLEYGMVHTVGFLFRHNSVAAVL